MDVQTFVVVVGGGALAIVFGWCGWLTRQNQCHVARHARLVEALNNFKIEVAKEYVSVPHLQEVEKRLADGIDRIEEKLDRMIEGRPRFRGSE